MNILVTGGAGYIGSITNKLLQDQGHTTVVFDNLQNGYEAAVGDTPLIVGDLLHKNDINEVFEKHTFDAVIHFAALARAGESMEDPARYIENNVLGGINLLEAMRKGNCKHIIFSSTCAVYGYPDTLPVTEDAPIAPVSVYGSSKRMFEEVISWYEQLYGMRSVILRYFNACGALEDGSMGEHHQPETHIIPIAFDVASGKRDQFELFGDDYDTPDGTCIRDYIHVVDLARAHIQAVEYLHSGNDSTIVNLGVGKGYSNKEVLAAVERVSGKSIPVVLAPKRDGDPAAIYADNTKAKRVLSWEPTFRTIEDIVKSAWAWHSSHPDGYR